MNTDKKYQKVVASGTWIYDNSVEMPVIIVEQNYDFWYELAAADGMLEEGEQPELNEAGLIYYGAFRGEDIGESVWVHTYGDHTIEEAKLAAEARLPSPVSWKQS